MFLAPYYVLLQVLALILTKKPKKNPFYFLIYKYNKYIILILLQVIHFLLYPNMENLLFN